jgi:hypothetical protein
VTADADVVPADAPPRSTPAGADTRRDAGEAAARDAGAMLSDAAAATGGAYACTEVIGIQATGEWYAAGFEKLVDDGRWQLRSVHNGFVELWADPKNAVWSTAPSSRCATGSDDPDRVIFVGLNWDYRSMDPWIAQLSAVVGTLRARYPRLRRIELATFVRAPGNQPCPQGPPYRSTIYPFQDRADEVVAAMFPDVVRVAPRLEVAACSDFSDNPPHFTAAGAAHVAAIVARAYAANR